MPNKYLLIFLCMFIFGIGLVSSEEIPFYQCVEISGTSVEDIDCFFSQGNISINETMTRYTSDNEFCFFVNDSSYVEGSYGYVIYCNDSVESVNLNAIFQIGGDALPLTGSSGYIPPASEKEEGVGFDWESIPFVAYIFGFCCLGVILFVADNGRRKKK